MREPVGLNRLKTSWEKGPEAHLNLWRRLRAGGRQVRVVAVAWEQSLPTRAGKDSRDEDAPDTLRKAIAEGDWETIEQHGGLNEVMSKIGKRAEGGRIDGFTLWRSERCRQIGAHPTKGTWCSEVVRALAFLPEAARLPRCGRPSRQDARIRTGKGMRRTPPTPTGRKGRPCGPFTRPAGDAPDG